MRVMLGIVFALFGLVFGSFLTVLVARLPRRVSTPQEAGVPASTSGSAVSGRSTVSDRSACPRCGAMIGARDNVPVVSYLVLRGRCRNCRGPISPAYPMIELASAGLFVVASLAIDDAWVAAMVAPFLGILLAAALIDARHFVIPNRLVGPSMAVFGAAILVLELSGRDVSALGALLGLLAYGGGLLVLHLVSPRGMGFGDVKFAALIGMVMGSLGWPYVAVAGVAAVVSASLVGVVVLALGGTGKSKLPFGVFMAFGTLMSVLFATPIASWYLGLAG